MKNTTRFSLALVAFALLAFSTVPAFAQAPASLPVQGYLTDAEGAPLEGTADLTFTLYNASGDALFTTTQSAALDRGAFSVVLGGQGGPLDLTIFRDNSVLQLGVAVNGGAELSPRFDIATSPFAAFAQYASDATTLEGLAATDFARAGQIDFADINNIPTGVDDGDDDTVGDLTCNAGEVPTWDGAAWVCGVTSDTVGALNCTAGQVAKYDGTAWTCTGEFAVAANLATVAATGSFTDLANVPADLADGDQDTTYTAGSGLTLAGTEFAIDTAALSAQFVNEGQAGAISTAMLADNAVTTAKLQNNAVTAPKIANNAVTAFNKIDWHAGSNSDLVITSDCGSFVPMDFCHDRVGNLADCDDPDVAVGSICEYDAGCTVTSTVTFDGFLDNCSSFDIYMRVN